MLKVHALAGAGSIPASSLLMQFMSNYTWTNNFHNFDTFFVDETLNWDEVFSLLFLDYTPFSFLLISSFLESHFFTDSIVKLSFLDVILLNHINSTASTNSLYLFFLWDNSTLLDNYYLYLNNIFFTDYQNLVTLILYYSPELTLALTDFYTSYSGSLTLEQTPGVFFDTYKDGLNLVISEFLQHYFLLFLFTWLVLLTLVNFRLNTWWKSVNSYFLRIYNYLFWMARTIRIQFDGMIQAFFFIFLYVTLLIVTFDDDQEESLELFNNLCFYFFLFTFLFYFFKYSIHFFSFLEPSKVGGRSVMWIAGQFYTDLFNTVSLTMRFLVLMIRLNIYDGVDDILDSYYIFVADFEEDDYFIDLFFSAFTTMFFDLDNNDDRSFLLEDEVDFVGDLFTVYFVIWGKFFFFLLFILEILARMTLALYVTYLIIFEINAVNRSYSEDSYLLNKRASRSTADPSTF